MLYGGQFYRKKVFGDLQKFMLYGIHVNHFSCYTEVNFTKNKKGKNGIIHELMFYRNSCYTESCCTET